MDLCSKCFHVENLSECEDPAVKCIHHLHESWYVRFLRSKLAKLEAEKHSLAQAPNVGEAAPYGLLEDEIKHLRKRVNVLKTDNARLEAEHDDADTICRNLKHELRSMSDYCDQLKKQLADITPSKHELKAKMSKLRHERWQTQEALKRAKEAALEIGFNNHAEIERLKAELAQSELRDRSGDETIRALQVKVAEQEKVIINLLTSQSIKMLKNSIEQRDSKIQGLEIVVRQKEATIDGLKIAKKNTEEFLDSARRALEGQAERKEKAKIFVENVRKELKEHDERTVPF